jgi:post-segregation antitoxin (ccd killing protein)
MVVQSISGVNTVVAGLRFDRQATCQKVNKGIAMTMILKTAHDGRFTIVVENARQLRISTAEPFQVREKEYWCEGYATLAGMDRYAMRVETTSIRRADRPGVRVSSTAFQDIMRAINLALIAWVAGNREAIAAGEREYRRRGIEELRKTISSRTAELERDNRQLNERTDQFFKDYGEQL